MTQTVSIFSDDGKQAVFQGNSVFEILLWESKESSVQLLATVFERAAVESTAEKRTRFVCRVVAKNLGHMHSGVCHSTSRASMAPLETQALIEAPTFAKALKYLFKSYPDAEPVHS